MNSADLHLDILKAYIARAVTLQDELQEVVDRAKVNFGSDELHRVVELLGRLRTDGDLLSIVNKLAEEHMTGAQQEILEVSSKRLVEVRAGVMSLNHQLERLIVACFPVQ